MTEALEVRTDALVQVVPESGETMTFPIGDLLLEGDNPETISDAQLIARAERATDQPAGAFRGYVVDRPETGNFVVHKAAIYG